MVNNYNPWNKKGAGAPNDDIRIRNLEMDGLFPVANVLKFYSKGSSQNDGIGL
jgi:hypothetical protein